MRKLLLTLAVLLLIVPVAQAEHIMLDGSVAWVRSTDPLTPPNQLNGQLSLFYKAKGGLWLGAQASSDENANVTGGVTGLQMLPVGLSNDKGHQWAQLGVTGWYDFNEEAFDFANATAGLLVRLTPKPDSKLGMSLAFLADGYEDILEEIVRVAGREDGINSTPPQDVLVVTEDNGVAFQLKVGLFWHLD